VGKGEVRALAKELAVPSAEKAASPCLASRLPYGTEVTPEILAQVDRAEQGLTALGYQVLRVRHYGEVGRVEMAQDELERVLAEPAPLREVLRRAGYRRAEINRRPFRSGSLNELISFS